MPELTREQKDIKNARAAAWRVANPDKVKAYTKMYWRERMTPEAVLFNNAKNRAKAVGVPFSLTIDDIVIPDVCPILGIPILNSARTTSAGSPSLDRIIPNLGYVAGNVHVISHRANTIKSNSTLADMEMLYTFMKGR